MNDQQKAIACGLGAVLCWSTVATAFKLSLGYLSPPQLVLLATAASWLLLFGVLLGRKQGARLLHGSARAYLRALLLGAINPFLYYLVLFRAYELLPAQEAQALNYTWALTMALLAVPLLGHRLRPAELLAALVSYGGVLVIATHGELLAMEFVNPAGVGFALLSTVLWAFYWLFNTRAVDDPVLALFWNFSAALPLLLLFCGLTGELQAVPWRGVLGAAYIGVFEMGLSFILWQYALQLTRSTIQVSSLIFLAPPLSLVLIHLVLGEQILASTIVGLALILLGLLLQQLAASRDPA